MVVGVEAGTGIDRGHYLLTHFTPKSDEQLRWEGDVRAAVQLVLPRGMHQRMSEAYVSFIRSTLQDAANADLNYNSGNSFFGGISHFLDHPGSLRVKVARRLELAGQLFEELPLYVAERSFGNDEHKASISSTNPVAEAEITKTFENVRRGLRVKLDSSLFPQFGFEDCDLGFYSSAWRPYGHERVITATPLQTLGGFTHDYVPTDKGLELPSYVRHQIDAVVEVVKG